MSKTKEELNELKKEIEDLNKKCRELTEEELKEVAGGSMGPNVSGVIGSAVVAEILYSVIQ